MNKTVHLDGWRIHRDQTDVETLPPSLMFEHQNSRLDGLLLSTYILAFGHCLEQQHERLESPGLVQPV